jgi:sodium/hydrogen antiporter
MMPALLTFGLTLFAAVLLSAFAHRSIASTAVLFLVAGFICGDGMLGVLHVSPDSPILRHLAEFALFAVLFTDGMELGLGRLRAGWKLPARALAIGLPLTLLATAAAAHWVVGVSWVQAFLIGAVLSPTDPVFASAIVARPEVPGHLRHLLNVESGVNDGLALPIVLVLLSHLTGEPKELSVLLLEVLAGVALGVSVAWVASKLELATDLFSVSEKYAPFFALSVAVIVFGLASLTRANEYLASYLAGATLATVHPKLREEFRTFGERVSELLKLAALLAFGALISLEVLNTMQWQGYFFAALVLLIARPLAMEVALQGTDLSRREKWTAFWFGPKGFASVVYGIMVLKSSAPEAQFMFHLIALVVAASILAHSSTDVVMARRFTKADAASAPEKAVSAG